MEFYTYKGISAGKYVEGEIEALNQDEASHKLKEQKLIITNLCLLYPSPSPRDAPLARLPSSA